MRSKGGQDSLLKKKTFHLRIIWMNKDYFQHDLAVVETGHIGKDTRIWAFAHILSGAKIGSNCNICDHTFIENDVIIGNNVTIKCGVYLRDAIRVEDDVFIGPNATFTNDKYPRSKQKPEKYSPIILKKGCSIGANATILPNVTIGANAIIGAGAIITKNVPPNITVTNVNEIR